MSSGSLFPARPSVFALSRLVVALLSVVAAGAAFASSVISNADGNQDYSDTAAMENGILAGSTFALLTQGGATTYYYRPTLDFSSRYITVWNSQASIFAGIDSEESRRADSLTITADGSDSAFAVYSYQGQTEIRARDLVAVTAQGGNWVYGIWSYQGTNEVSVSGENGTLQVNVESDVGAIGALSQYGDGVLTLSAKNISVEASGTGSKITDYVAIEVMSGIDSTTVPAAPENRARIELRSEAEDGQITLSSKGLGIAAFSYGLLTVDGNLTINAPYAFYVRGNAEVNINTDAAKVRNTVINGDVVFGTPADSASGTLLDANLNIRLAGAASSWTGASYSAIGLKGEAGEPDNQDPTGSAIENFRLTLADGAQWNVTGDSFVNSLTIEGQGNQLVDNDHAVLIRELVFTDDSELQTTLNVAYESVDRNSEGVVIGAVPLRSVQAADGSATLSITDTFFYSQSGLAALTSDYQQKNIAVLLKNASLWVSEDDRRNGVAFEIPENSTVELLAKGEAEDVASEVPLRISGTVNVVRSEDADTKSGASSSAKLGKAEVVNGGTLGIHTTVLADEIHVDERSQLLVGNKDKAGKLVVSALELKGTLFLDPVWDNGEASSEASVTLKDDALPGALVVGRNSKIEIGSADTSDLDQALLTLERTISETDLQAAAYVNKSMTLGSHATLLVDGSLAELPDAKDASMDPGVFVASNAALFVNAKEGKQQAVITGEGGKFTIEGTLYVDKATAGSTVYVAKGFDSVTLTNAPLAVNRLMSLQEVTSDIGSLTLQVGANEALASATIAPNVLGAVISGASGTGADRAAALFDVRNGLSDSQAAHKMNAIALMGSASASQVLAVNTGTMVMDTIDQHGSALAGASHQKAGADLWVDVSGSFSKANSYSAGSATYGFRSDLAGATLGADYSFSDSLTAGAAFSFGKGSARGKGEGDGTKNDVDYFGFNFYGVWSTPYVNIIGSAGYGVSKNEITQFGFKGKPEVKVLSLSVRTEKSFALSEDFSLTPHVGVRYLNVDMESFSAGGFDYTAKKANLVQIPVGVAFSGKFKAPYQAEAKPFVDVSVIPVAGSKSVTNRFALSGVAEDSFSTQIANSVMYTAKVGLNTTKGNHSLGVHYAVGIGNSGRTDQSLQARYRYRF